MNQRCDGLSDCIFGSDEQDCSLIVSNIKFDKYLIPPPLESDRNQIVDFSLTTMAIQINEEENYMSISLRVIKEWYNSYLTFQNLKKEDNSEDNLLNPEEKSLIWVPWFSILNSINQNQCIRMDEPEIFKVVPNKNFTYEPRKLSHYQNAFLFKV